MCSNLAGLLQTIKSEEEGEAEDCSKNIPIPLLSVDVVASVVHAVGQVEVSQVYMNKEDRPIEAIYYFPVNPEGAVTHFQVEIEGRIIKGVVKEKEEAKTDYDYAVTFEKTAFLGQEITPDIFKVRVGFLKPGQQVKVVIGYVTEVKNEPGSNAIRFYIPTTIAPRYGSPFDTDEKVKKELQQMWFSKSPPAPLSLKVAVSLQEGIRSVESPTHSVKVNRISPIPQNPEWHKALVELSGKVTDMDRDFVLNIVPEEKIHKPRLYSEKRKDGSVAMMLHLVPSFKLDELKTERIFLLDRSDSMQGESIVLAKKALLLFMNSMPADCYFNVIGFGSTIQFLLRTSVKLSDDTLSKALQHARTLAADLGGAEILEPLKEIYATPKIEGYLRQIFILTNGQVSNTDGVIGISKTHAPHARVFALGIGDGASHALVEGVAKAGGGTCAFVTVNESVDKKVQNLLKNASQPSLTDIQLKWKGLDTSKPESITKFKNFLGYNKTVDVQKTSESYYRQSPQHIPPIYDGSQLLVFGLFHKKCPSGVTITAESPDGPLTLKIKHSEKNDVGSSNMLHHLARVKWVRELETEVSAISFNGGPHPHALQEAEQLEKNIIQSTRIPGGNTCKYTSFVAVDRYRYDALKSWVMERRHVPQQIGHGWQGTFCPATDDSSPDSGNERDWDEDGQREQPAHSKSVRFSLDRGIEGSSGESSTASAGQDTFQNPLKLVLKLS